MSFSWDDPQAVGVSVADGSVMFAVRFDVVGGAGSVSAVAFSDAVAACEATVNLQPVSFQPVAGQVQVLGAAPAPVPGEFMLSKPVFAAGSFGVAVPTVAGKNYILEYKDSLSAQNWKPLPGGAGQWRGAGALGSFTGGGAALLPAAHRVVLEVYFMNTELLRTESRRKVAAVVLLWLLVLGLAMGRARAAALTFAVGATNAVTNSQVVVPIRVTNFTAISSFQFSFHWNTNVARFMGVEQFALPGQTTNDFGLLTNDFGVFPEGTLAGLWFEPNGISTNVPDGTQIFGIRFQFVGPAAATCPVRIDGNPTAIFAADGNLDPVVVEIVDNILSIDRTLIVSCQPDKVVECGTVWDFDVPVATDSCGGLPVTVNVLSTVTNFTGTCGFTATRTWEMLDPCTNRTVCVQTVTAMDTTPPVPVCVPDKTIEFGQAWDFDAPSGVDLCIGTNVTVVVSGTVTNAGPCGLMFMATRTWLILDGCSNQVSCSQMVTVQDTTAPVIVCAPDKSVNCLRVWSFDGPSASDIADGANVTIEVVSTVTNGSCGASFVATRTWRATDRCGNFSECSQSAYGRAIVTVSGAMFLPTNYPPTPNDKRVATATLVGPTNTTTATVGDGSFDLTFDAANDVVIEAFAPAGGQPADGVSTLDITFLRRHILNLALLDTPYKRLAGDVDGSASITTLDLSFVRRLVLGSTNRFPRGLWRFVPADYVFPNPSAPWNAPTNRTYASVGADAGGAGFSGHQIGGCEQLVDAASRRRAERGEEGDGVIRGDEWGDVYCGGDERVSGG